MALLSSSCRTADRHYVHCLRCLKPQNNISVHLTRVCMKKCTPEERAVELRKAKDSAREWSRSNRTWDYTELCELLPHRPCRTALVNDLLRRGFLIKNKPHDSDLAMDPAVDATTNSAASTTSAAASVPSSPENSSSSSDPGEGRSDPSWQK